MGTGRHKLCFAATAIAFCLSARAQTLEKFQKEIADQQMGEVEKLYLKGAGEAMQLMNVAFVTRVAETMKAADAQQAVKLGVPLYLFCPPVKLVLDTGNYVSIIQEEAKRELAAAGTDAVKTRAVMQTNVLGLLYHGLVNTFPCTPEAVGSMMKFASESTSKQHR
jgi:hypothetical protein